MKNLRVHLPLISLLVLTLCAAVVPAGAGSHDSAAADSKGVTLRIVVPLAPGGVYDLWARIAARHLGKYLPGRRTIVVQNMPGGGGYIGMNFLYNAAPRDGSTIGMVLADLALAQRIQEPGVQYDALKFHYLGNPSGASRVFWLRSALPYRTVEELRGLKKPLVGGAIRRTSATYTVPVFFSEGAGFPLRMVTGYPGMAPVMAALERGEVDATAADIEAPPALSRWKANLIRPIAYLGVPKKAVKEAGIPDVFDLDLKPQAAALFRLILPIEHAPFPFVAPPGVAQERVVLLQRAFDKVFQDPQFIAEAEKAGATVLPTSGPDLLRLQESVFKAPADVVARYNAIVTEP
jgi:tripartite-type tricarboxylate transporter receptor subunit TctC